MIKQGKYVTLKQLDLDNADKVMLDFQLPSCFTVGLIPDEDYFSLPEGFFTLRDYTPKYERFLRNNNIRYEFFDIKRTDWIDKAKEFDLIIWHTSSDICYQRMAKDKIYFMENKMKKHCFPSFDAIWGYENKINSHYLYSLYNLPEIPTFVTFSKSEAYEYVNSVKFPIISKVTTGSASKGVDKITSKRNAIRLINKIFSLSGYKGHCKYENQKNYVYFQEFISNAKFDLRIIVVGNKLFGYYRYPNKGDFRASGAGIYQKKSIPSDALNLAYKIKNEVYNVPRLAVDLLQDENTGQYYIIETSIFIGVDTCEQLIVDGVPGYYLYKAEGIYEFHKGRYWMQELELLEVFENYKTFF